ncbi:hypothetical protein PRIPAC_71612 [Pristionchus pacificus]|uniref:Uncharacterized protein n=1 Tax=Pristionchus pacificus TaxID=54126 RepID=A0A2A6CTC0_PRIPA|nr:hypothetical protein PRIPAC_71612 [Pristionchus pacificus]|eukprot:PDM81336.1 hypothetical protein PRIPAC_36339 [Pristionchus pacificus]
MGLPAIQLIMIAARQVSKPIAEALINYGKNHPLFRNRVLIPVGRSLVHLTTRLRMKKLGLGSPTTVATVSEATALEQASDFIQQVVLFSYSVGVFAGYYYYTKWFTSETMKVDEFEKWKEENQRENSDLMQRIKRLEDALVAAKWKLPPLPEVPKKEESPPPPSPPAAAPAATAAPTVAAQPVATETKKEIASPSTALTPSPSQSSSTSSLTSSILRFPRISSLPLDSASKIVLEGEPYTFCKRDASISFERGDPDLRFLRFRPKENSQFSSGFVGLSERALGYITGCA